MFLQMKQVSAVDNVGKYAEVNVKELEELLLSGESAVPHPKRKDFYDLQNDERTSFIQISLITGRVGLLTTWLRAKLAVAIAG
jgi:hypothetical protein